MKILAIHRVEMRTVYTTKAKGHNKSEKLFGHPERYPKCDI